MPALRIVEFLSMAAGTIALKYVFSIGDFLFNRFVSVDCRENRQRQGAGVGRTLWAL